MWVISFDDVMLGTLSNPPLTTMHAPLDQLGPAALQLLEQRLIAADPNRPATHLDLECRLIERASVAPPR